MAEGCSEEKRQGTKEEGKTQEGTPHGGIVQKRHCPGTLPNLHWGHSPYISPIRTAIIAVGDTPHTFSPYRTTVMNTPFPSFLLYRDTPSSLSPHRGHSLSLLNPPCPALHLPFPNPLTTLETLPLHSAQSITP